MSDAERPFGHERCCSTSRGPRVRQPSEVDPGFGMVTKPSGHRTEVDVTATWAIPLESCIQPDWAGRANSCFSGSDLRPLDAPRAIPGRADHRTFGKTDSHGIRSTVRPTGLDKPGEGAFRSPQERGLRRLSRSARPTGIHAASGRRKVHSRRGGGVHRPVTRRGVQRSTGGSTNVNAVRHRAVDASHACRAACRRASTSRLDTHRTIVWCDKDSPFEAP
jgi:hypothetical protein